MQQEFRKALLEKQPPIVGETKIKANKRGKRTISPRKRRQKRTDWQDGKWFVRIDRPGCDGPPTALPTAPVADRQSESCVKSRKAIAKCMWPPKMETGPGSFSKNSAKEASGFEDNRSEMAVSSEESSGVSIQSSFAVVTVVPANASDLRGIIQDYKARLAEERPRFPEHGPNFATEAQNFEKVLLKMETVFCPNVKAKDPSTTTQAVRNRGLIRTIHEGWENLMELSLLDESFPL